MRGLAPTRQQWVQACIALTLHVAKLAGMVLVQQIEGRIHALLSSVDESHTCDGLTELPLIEFTGT